MSKVRVLFVCLGNICRSPAAEAVMNTLVAQAGLEQQIVCDSAGTAGHHEGESADPRTIKHAQKRGHEVTSLSRPFNAQKDFDGFDLIVAMDNTNFSDLLDFDVRNKYRDKIFKMTDFSSHKKFTHVPDPYYGGADGFETVMDILEDACQGLLQKIKTTLL